MEVIIDRSCGRASTSLLLEWTLSPSENVAKRRKILKLSNIKAGAAAVDYIERSDARDVPVTPISRLTHRQPSEDTESEDIETSPLSAAKPADAVVHGDEWFEQGVLCAIGGVRDRYDWFVCTPSDDVLSEGSRSKKYSPYDCFMTMFPQSHLLKIVNLTSEKLARIGRKMTCPVEILRCFGILIFCTRFEFGNRSSLWNVKRSSKYVPAPEVG